MIVANINIYGEGKKYSVGVNNNCNINIMSFQKHSPIIEHMKIGVNQPSIQPPSMQREADEQTQLRDELSRQITNNKFGVQDQHSGQLLEEQVKQVREQPYNWPQLQQPQMQQISVPEHETSNYTFDSEQYLQMLGILGQGTKFTPLSMTSGDATNIYLPYSTLNVFAQYDKTPSEYPNMRVQSSSENKVLSQVGLYMKDPTNAKPYRQIDNVNSIAECAQLCTNDKKCFTFGYYPNRKQCFLREPAVESYVKIAAVENTEMGLQGINRVLRQVRQPSDVQEPEIMHYQNGLTEQQEYIRNDDSVIRPLNDASDREK